LRQPSSDISPEAVSLPDVSDEMIQRHSEQLKTGIMSLFPKTLFSLDPWNHFSNDNWTKVHPQQGTMSSLESIHDSIHGYVGGSGHFGTISVAAFDPIFWLHHCQIDRLFALWQAVYPNVYVPEPGPII
jgi:tyrosinase